MKGNNFHGRGIKYVKDLRPMIFEGIFEKGVFKEGIRAMKNNISMGKFVSEKLEDFGMWISSEYACKGNFKNDVPHGGQVLYICYKDDNSE